jgi:hypothetical protein
MAYIFMDESGDLGFDPAKKSSKYFMVTFLAVSQKRPLEKTIRKIYQGLKRKYRMRGGILHAFKEEPITRMRFYRELARKDARIMVLYLNKQRIYTKLNEEKPALYASIANTLLDRIMTKGLVGSEEEIELIASRRETSRFLNQSFRSYLEDQVKSNHERRISVSIKTPHEEKLLQAADLVSWAIFRKYEHQDESYCRLIQEMIVEESSLFP